MGDKLKIISIFAGVLVFSIAQAAHALDIASELRAVEQKCNQLQRALTLASNKSGTNQACSQRIQIAKNGVGVICDDLQKKSFGKEKNKTMFEQAEAIEARARSGTDASKANEQAAEQAELSAAKNPHESLAKNDASLTGGVGSIKEAKEMRNRLARISQAKIKVYNKHLSRFAKFLRSENDICGFNADAASINDLKESLTSAQTTINDAEKQLTQAEKALQTGQTGITQTQEDPSSLHAPAKAQPPVDRLAGLSDVAKNVDDSGFMGLPERKPDSSEIPSAHPFAKLRENYPGFTMADKGRYAEYDYYTPLTEKQKLAVESEIKKFKDAGLPTELADTPLRRILEAEQRNPGIYKNKNVAMIADIRPTIASDKTRFYFLDREKGEIAHKDITTHGRANAPEKENRRYLAVSKLGGPIENFPVVSSENGKEYATRFGDLPSSYSSPIGLFVTDPEVRNDQDKNTSYKDSDGNVHTLYGGPKTKSVHSVSLGLKGLDPTNQNANGSVYKYVDSKGRSRIGVYPSFQTRHIQFHNCWYATAETQGRTQGCICIADKKKAREIAFAAKGGSPVYYYNGI